MKKRFVAILCFVLSLCGGVFSVGCDGANDYLKYELLVDGTYSVGLNEEYLENFTIEVNEDFVVPSIKKTTNGIGKKFGEVPRNIELPDSYNGKLVTKIADGGFANDNIESVTLPTYTSYIGVAAFYGAGLTEIKLPCNVTTIEEYAFYENNFSSLSIPDETKKMGKYAFAKNPELSSVKLGRGIAFIEKGLFSGCNKLTSIVIPSNIRLIEDFAFSYMDEPENGRSTELKNVLFKGGKSEWEQVVMPDVIATRVETLYYAENGDISEFVNDMQSVQKVWTYNDKQEAEIIELIYDDTVDGKTYAFSHSEVTITYDGWETLCIYDKSDRLRDLLTKDEVEMFKKSKDKEEYMALCEAYGLNKYKGERIVFENESMRIRYGDNPALHSYSYKVVNGKVYLKIGDDYSLGYRYIIADGCLIEEHSYIYGSEKFYFTENK